MTFLSKLSILSIKKYQSHKKHGSYFDVDCNFIPSCSEYTKICIYRFGFLKGWFLGINRILRCTNRDLLNKYYDPPPEKKV
ncbi:MAG: membrane protein insertion efficiency factor YidD [Thermodesulfobacteriota bacterium]|nr:membrane protein insertion efficiency factor YidD [Thermodesulfobacteriota bacterium]